jgi:hypothetical protein
VGGAALLSRAHTIACYHASAPRAPRRQRDLQTLTLALTPTPTLTLTLTMTLTLTQTLTPALIL